MNKITVWRFLLIFFLIIISIVRVTFWWPKNLVIDEETKTFTATIIRAPQRGLAATKLIVKNDQDQRILISTGLWPIYHYGDRLKINCRLQKPEPINDFRYDWYLARDKIFLSCYSQQIEIVSRHQGNKYFAKLLAVTDRLANLVDSAIPPPAGELLKAMLLGQRAGLDADLLNKFSLTGVTHVISISGLHVALIVSLLDKVGLSLGLTRRQNFYAVMIFLFLFITAVGWPACAIRSAVMGGLALLAGHVGRLPDNFWALLIVSVVMIAINPLLVVDVGFQLSVAAVWGLQTYGPLLKNQLASLSWPTFIVESLAMTLAAQIPTIPIILYHFGQASLISPLANIIVVPLMSLSLILALAGLLGGLLLPKIVSLFLWPARVILELGVAATDLLSRWPYAALADHQISIWLVCLWLILAFIGQYLWSKKVV